MFCSRCGRELGEGFSFCPGCGASVVRPDTARPGDNYPPYVQQYQPPWAAPPQKKGSGSTKVLVTILVALLLFVGVIGAVATFYGPEEESSFTQYLGNGDYLVLSGDFLPERNVLTVRLDPDQIAFVLDDEISSDYSYYSWGFFDRDHPVYEERSFTKYMGSVVEKKESTLYLLVPKAGVFTVSVVCYTGTAGSYHAGAAYSGKIEYYTDVNINQTWKYDGKDYNLSVKFKYADYEDYRNKNTNGRWPVVSQYTSFVDYNDPVVADIAGKLRTLYGPSYPGDPGLANFVLGYVQNCYGYPPFTGKVNADEFLYGSMEYFAYPLETIFLGQGDCEDTSILVDAILHVLGYDTALLILPEHAMAGVALSGYSPDSGHSYEVLSQTVDGKTYYAGETTITFTRAFGLAPADGNGDHPFSYYLESLHNDGRYMFYVI
jgi:hypothetical protein